HRRQKTRVVIVGPTKHGSLLGHVSQELTRREIMRKRLNELIVNVIDLLYGTTVVRRVRVHREMPTREVRLWTLRKIVLRIVAHRPHNRVTGQVAIAEAQ